MAILQASAIRGIRAPSHKLSSKSVVGDWRQHIAHVDLLDLRRFETFLDAQHRILTNSPVTAYLPAREVEPGVWIGRNVMIHPTAQLTPPLFIGEIPHRQRRENCPNAVVGHDTIIDQHTHIVDSAVMNGSYCGEHLELDH